MRLLTPLLLTATATGTLALAQAQAQAQAPFGSLDPTATTAQREAFISEMKKRIAINGRDRGPFGLPQEKVSQIIPDCGLGGRVHDEKLAALLSKLQISAVNAESGTFLVEAREFRSGEVFPLIRRGEQIQVQVLEVKGNAIIFKNLATGNPLTRPIKLAPSQNIDFQEAPRPHGIEPANPAGGLPVYLSS